MDQSLFYSNLLLDAKLVSALMGARASDQVSDTNIAKIKFALQEGQEGVNPVQIMSGLILSSIPCNKLLSFLYFIEVLYCFPVKQIRGFAY